jgi:hypothetical protein
MSQSIKLELPDDTVRRYRRGARAAHKSLTEFVAERLRDAAPPIADDLPSPLREELEAMEKLDDDALWQITQSQLSPAKQRTYSRLLRKNSQSPLTAREQTRLALLGDEARRLTLMKSHAFLILKWRGHAVPALSELTLP